ncbi:MAG: thiamine pyrophosphate-binding protein [Lachnospiraceae bacterium]|nr:thiamine pyrophosphate-binding protein [Lachnospiraceae bacterium]
MRIKVSNYISQFLVEHGIDTAFTVTGGGAMHLNDALGHQEGLTCYYNHHEQACAMAAESYARIQNKIAAVCVTTGPGGTNALTGVLGGWLDSIPMFILSGQVRYDTTARSTGLPIRAVGDQEFDICKAVASMTKYCEMVIEPKKIRYCLEKALYIANTGRPGPCWLDIPLNVQGSYIDTEELEGYIPEQEIWDVKPVLETTIDEILKKVRNAKRPVINAGNGIRIADAYPEFQELVRLLSIPVVTGWDSIDLMPDDDELYVGRAGIMGDRAGNFAIQNSDLILSLGSRLSIRQVGYNHASWAREAYTIVVDIDENELKKPTIRVDMPVCADVKDVMQKLNEKLQNCPNRADESWIHICRNWKEKYPVVQAKHYRQQDKVNVYAFIKELSSALPKDYITVVGNGSACVVGSHAYVIKEGQRFIINSGAASMGYDLPAAIGACIAGGKKEIVCISGDGSIQMNLQELQTIITNQLPIKIFVINNEGYHSIRQTQGNFFGEPFVGIGPDSHDLSFPSLEKLAWAYGYPYFSCDENEKLDETIKKVFEQDGYAICEVFVDKNQKFEPKSGTKQMPDGSLVSAPLEDLAPFLPKEELEENMLIPLYQE